MIPAFLFKLSQEGLFSGSFVFHSKQEATSRRESFERFRRQIDESEAVEFDNLSAPDRRHNVSNAVANPLTMQSSESSSGPVAHGASSDELASSRPSGEEFVVDGKTCKDLQECLVLFFEKADTSTTGFIERSKVRD
jgi:hypothetical protein